MCDVVMTQARFVGYAKEEAARRRRLLLEGNIPSKNGYRWGTNASGGQFCRVSFLIPPWNRTDAIRLRCSAGLGGHDA